MPVSYYAAVYEIQLNAGTKHGTEGKVFESATYHKSKGQLLRHFAFVIHLLQLFDVMCMKTKVIGATHNSCTRKVF